MKKDSTLKDYQSPSTLQLCNNACLLIGLVRKWLVFVRTNKNPKCWCKMIVRTMVEICAKFLISRLKIGEAMDISLVAMAAATLILFPDEVCELIEARISFYIFFWFSCRQFLFTMSIFREIRRKYLI